jgi:hypothetical protein
MMAPILIVNVLAKAGSKVTTTADAAIGSTASWL